MNKISPTKITQENDHYIFELDKDVIRKKVSYYTRYGIEIAADLYYKKNLDLNKKNVGLVIGPPFGGVKEQGPGVYANQLAKYGYVIIAFDPAYHGYSGGEPRYTGSPDTYLEDFSAAVDYLTTLDFVDEDKIAAIGICASGGFALGAAAQDARIKAVVTSVMYDIPRLAGQTTGEERNKQLITFSKLRTTDPTKYQLNYPTEPQDSIPANLPPVQSEFFSFYGTKRGWHKHALTNITDVSNLSFMNFEATDRINEISPRPVLMITSEEAHSKQFTLDTYKRLKEPKKLDIEPKGQHIDFYDNIDVIPFNKIDAFLRNSLQ